MGQIRAFQESDISQVVQLRRKVFQKSERSSDAALGDYFREVFFRNPWYDPEMPSLVFEENDQGIVGFFGIVPRPMIFCGRPIRVAICTHLMVDPARRGLVALSLLKELIAGPQDLTLADCANETSRTIWPTVGGSVATLHSFFWTKPLSCSRYGAGSFAYRRKRVWTRDLFRGMFFLLRPVLNTIDWIATSNERSVFSQRRPSGSTEELEVGTMVAMLDKFAASRRLRPVYTEKSLLWIFESLDQKTQYGSLQKVLVRGDNQEPLGWFVYFANPGGRGEVVQVAASKGRCEMVLQHLWYHARQQGTVALSGRIDPEFLADYETNGCSFGRSGPWTLVHSRNIEVLEAIFRGDVFLTRLEGEWWLSF